MIQIPMIQRIQRKRNAESLSMIKPIHHGSHRSSIGEGAGFGQDQFPSIIYGPPLGSGPTVVP